MVTGQNIWILAETGEMTVLPLPGSLGNFPPKWSETQKCGLAKENLMREKELPPQTWRDPESVGDISSVTLYTRPSFTILMFVQGREGDVLPRGISPTEA